MILERVQPWHWFAIRRIAVCLQAGVAIFFLASALLTPLRAETEPSSESTAAFSNFDDWWKQYMQVPAVERAALVKKGTTLAKIRSEAMLKLIESDPATAIQKAFAEEYHSALPKPIGELVEQHVRALGKFTVTKGKNGNNQRRVTIGDESWKAFLYGRRLDLSSREEIPIHGVALDGRMAVDGSPLERFPDRESLLNVLHQSEGKKTCPICGEPGTMPVAVGDILMWFDSEEHLTTTEKALVEKEVNPEIGE